MKKSKTQRTKLSREQEGKGVCDYDVTKNKAIERAGRKGCMRLRFRKQGVSQGKIKSFKNI